VSTALTELYFYWRVRPGASEAAVAAARDFQRRLAERVPRLQARLLRRAGGDGATLMEIYTHPDGVDAGLQRTLQDEGDTCLASWLNGARHLEAFEPVSC
jgi:hypothetical protein